MPSRSLSNPPLRNQWTRLDRVWQACQQKQEASYAGWLRGLTDEELDDLIRAGDICRAVSEGLLPQDAWTEQQSDLWTEAMNRAKAWAQAGGDTG